MNVLLHRSAIRLAVLALVAVALTAVTATAAHAAMYNVTTTNDDDPAISADCTTSARGIGVNPTPGCSLREAVASANATPDDDTINVPAGDYVLTNENDDFDGNADLDLVARDIDGDTSAGTLTLTGAGARATTIRSGGSVDGQAVQSRIFDIDGSTTFDPEDDSGCFFVPGAVVELIGLRLAEGVEGDEGGAIYVDEGGTDCEGDFDPAVDGRVTIRESALTRNTSGDDGGAIFNEGEVTLINSEVTLNNSRGDEGGGIYNEDSVTLINTTIGGNIAGEGGGGIRSRSDSFEDAGNGGDEVTAVVEATNATIAFNQAGDNGGGVFGQASFDGNRTTVFSPRNTIIANNKATDGVGDNCYAPGNTLSRGNNLEDSESCGLDAGGDLSGTDPLLGARRDNGGPTDTYALLAGSPAIDAGTNDGCPATDQRLVARPQGARCDIGAYEYVAPPAPAGATAVPAAAAPGSTVTNNTVLVPVAFPRLLPRAVSARVAKSRTSRRGLRLRTTGRVTLPAGLSAREACTFGVITVQVKSGTRTVSTRLTELRDDCTYVSSVTFSVPSRLGRRVLSVAVRFAGNDRLQRRSAPRVSAGRP